MPVGVAALMVVRVAYGALPERRAEIVAAAMAGLEHTNDTYRMLALQAAYHFPEELLQRKELFLKLTLDEHQYVQAAALSDLSQVVYYSRLRPLMSLAEVRQAAEAVLDSPTTPERNKGMARNVIRYVDQQETQPVKSPAP